MTTERKSNPKPIVLDHGGFSLEQSLDAGVFDAVAEEASHRMKRRHNTCETAQVSDETMTLSPSVEPHRLGAVEARYLPNSPVLCVRVPSHMPNLSGEEHTTKFNLVNENEPRDPRHSPDDRRSSSWKSRICPKQEGDNHAHDGSAVSFSLALLPLAVRAASPLPSRQLVVFGRVTILPPGMTSQAEASACSLVIILMKFTVVSLASSGVLA